MSARTVQVSLSDELAVELNDLAADQGLTVDDLVLETIQNMLSQQREILESFEEGVREIERGDFYTNEQVRVMLDEMLQKRTAA